MDILDYGRRFTIDARRPANRSGEPSQQVEGYLLQLHSLLEGDHAPNLLVTVAGGDGVSAAVRGAEAHAVVHLFESIGALSLQVFSRRDVLLSDITRGLSERFGVGRFDSHLDNVSRALPKDEGPLRRMIMGDRDYARIRLGEDLLHV